jgi:hypothetical protein
MRWQYASDSETPQKGLYYQIRVATFSITDSLTSWIISPSTGSGTGFMANATIGNYPHGYCVASSTQPGFDLSNPIVGKTYYWQVRTVDTGMRKSAWSDVQSILVPGSPDAINDLLAKTGLYGRTIDLTWSAPGNNGMLGTLLAGSSYAIQRSTWTGVIFSTSSADTIVISTAGVNPGDPQSCRLASLIPGGTYYIRVWTADEAANWSYASNLASTQAAVPLLSITLPTTWYCFGNLGTAVSSCSASALTIRNSGNVLQNYQFSTTGSAHWSVGENAGPDQFKLQAAFHSSRPALADFDVNVNTITASATTCAANRLTINGSQLGMQVDPFINYDRTLWLKFSTPLMSSTSEQQDIPVTITAQESP